MSTDNSKEQPMERQQIEKAVKEFAAYMDNGFNAEEPLCQNHVEDFMRNYVVKPICIHEFTYMGDGDKQCKKCHVIE